MTQGFKALPLYLSKTKKNMKQYLPWTARIVVSVLFLLSAVSKMFPIWMFEKQMIDLGFADWCTAPYFVRLIIALELAIGIAILQKHFLRRFVIPVTILLLIAFCVHLSMEIAAHGSSGNCGCFGQLIPMTPVEALIKNILTIGIIIYIYRNVSEHEKGKNNFLVPAAIYAFSAWLMFMAFPFAPCKTDNNSDNTTTEEYLPENNDTTNTPMTSGTDVLVLPKDSATATSAPAGPAQVKSRFAEFTGFNGKTVNLDKGKKIVCLFAPGCDHCQATAKEIAQMQKKDGFPEVYILFMDEEAERIPEFFEASKIKAAHKVLDIPKFWTVMGSGNTPSVYYLWNGNVRYECEGTEDHAFDGVKLKAALEKE